MEKITLKIIVGALDRFYDLDYILDMWNCDKNKARKFYLDCIHRKYGLTLQDVLDDIENPAPPLTKQEHKELVEAIFKTVAQKLKDDEDKH